MINVTGSIDFCLFENVEKKKKAAKLIFKIMTQSNLQSAI